MANGARVFALNGQAKGIADCLAEFTIPKNLLDIIIVKNHEENKLNMVHDRTTDVAFLKDWMMIKCLLKGVICDMGDSSLHVHDGFEV